MRVLLASLAVLLSSPVAAFPSQDHLRDQTDLKAAETDGEQLLGEARGCKLEGLASLRTLLSRYEHRPEQNLRILAATARSKAGFINWFREQNQEAEHWYKSVVRLYGSENGISFQRLVADANYQLSRIARSRRSKEMYLDRVLTRYSGTDDPSLLHTYSISLFAKSDMAGEDHNEQLRKEFYRKGVEASNRIPRPEQSVDEPPADICL